MGILDSNKTIALKKRGTWVNLLYKTGENVDTKNFNSLEAIIKNDSDVDAEIAITLSNSSGNQTFGYAYPLVYVMEGGIDKGVNPLYNNRIILKAGQTKSILVDVSAATLIQFYNWTESADLKMMYSLDSTMRGKDAIVQGRIISQPLKNSGITGAFANAVNVCNDCIAEFVFQTDGNDSASIAVYGKDASGNNNLSQERVCYVSRNGGAYEKKVFAAYEKLGLFKNSKYSIIVDVTMMQEITIQQYTATAAIEAYVATSKTPFDESKYIPKSVEITNEHLNVKVIEDVVKTRIKTIKKMNGFSIGQHSVADNEQKILGAVLRDVAAWYDQTNVYLSLSGVEGEMRKIALDATNFPNLISDSKIRAILLLPYTRVASSTRTYSGNNWRLCVITNKDQIYHNFPSRSTSHDGTYVDGDEYRFDESVIWDLPERKTPVKTNTGADATMIATGCYRYMPCFADACYAMYPAINADNGYGNGGFGYVREYKDSFSNKTTKRPRFWNPDRGNDITSSFQWLSGLYQDDQITLLGTYISNTTEEGRLCVFTTSDGGREWFVQYEFGANGALRRHLSATNDYSIAPSAVFNKVAVTWGSNSIQGAYNVQKRHQMTPCDFDKKPSHKFFYDTEVLIESIVSNSSSILVTTASAHNLKNGDVVVFSKINEDARSFDWLVGDFDEDMCNLCWKARVTSDNTFILELEVANPNEPLTCRHIHTINKIKDGFIIGVGEEYMYGWILYMQIIGADNHGNFFGGNTYPMFRLTSTSASLQRILGMQINTDGEWIAGLDTSNITAKKITLPTGDEISRNSMGIYKGQLSDIDDFSKARCVCEVRDPAYFFKEINGKYIFVGQRGALAISTDGENWSQFKLPVELRSACQLCGVDSNNSVYIRYYGFKADTLVLSFDL